MIDSVIVTILCDKQEYDMELPAKVEISRLQPLIAGALSRKGLRLNSWPTLSCNGKLLDERATLFNAGVWDGSFLTVTLEGAL